MKQIFKWELPNHRLSNITSIQGLAKYTEMGTANNQISQYVDKYLQFDITISRSSSSFSSMYPSCILSNHNLDIANNLLKSVKFLIEWLKLLTNLPYLKVHRNASSSHSQPLHYHFLAETANHCGPGKQEGGDEAFLCNYINSTF